MNIKMILTIRSSFIIRVSYIWLSCIRGNLLVLTILSSIFPVQLYLALILMDHLQRYSLQVLSFLFFINLINARETIKQALMDWVDLLIDVFAALANFNSWIYFLRFRFLLLRKVIFWRRHLMKMNRSKY